MSQSTAAPAHLMVSARAGIGTHGDEVRPAGRRTFPLQDPQPWRYGGCGAITCGAGHRCHSDLLAPRHTFAVPGGHSIQRLARHR